jgi:hypothetical protein
MPAIITRAAKGTPLTNDELDRNQTNLEAPVMELWATQTSSFIAAPKGRYALTGPGIVVTLPANPPDGTEIWFRGSFGSVHSTILRNGATIAGIADDLILDMNYIMPKLVFLGGNWGVSQ